MEIYPSSQLYGDDDEMEALRLGAVELLAPSLSKFGRVGIPEFEVFDLPFLFNDFEQVRLVTHGPVGKRLLEKLGRQQMVGLGFMDSGFKQMSANKPLRTPEDFRHQRLRIQGSGVLVAQMRALGARPVVLPFGEIQRALANHVVDGAENSLSNFLTQELARFQSDVTLTQHGYLGYAVVANPRFWASLSAAEQTLLQAALEEALEFGNRLSADLVYHGRHGGLLRLTHQGRGTAGGQCDTRSFHPGNRPSCRSRSGHSPNRLHSGYRARGFARPCQSRESKPTAPTTTPRPR